MNGSTILSCGRKRPPPRPGGNAPNNLAIFRGGWHVARMNRFVKCFSVAAAMAVPLAGFSAGTATVTNLFGFSGPEIFPIDQQVSQLHVADLDGDGLHDIIVVNNLHSKITLLYNQTGKTNRADAAPTRKLELNELPPDSRFRIDSI